MEIKRTDWRYRVIKWLVRLFSPRYILKGEHNIPEEPCIIVGNHCHTYGPIASELYVPSDHYTWCVSDMMDRNKAAEYSFKDFWSGKPKYIRWFFKLMSFLIAPISELIFTNANTIPVYHDTKLLLTFRETVRKMAQGNSIVIFPESYSPHNNIVYSFQNRFVDVARLYYSKTKKRLSFVPMYVTPRLKIICFGSPVEYDPDVPIDEQRTKICDELMGRITMIARALPEHTVIPYPNIPKKEYPKNI